MREGRVSTIWDGCFGRFRIDTRAALLDPEGAAQELFVLHKDVARFDISAPDWGDERIIWRSLHPGQKEPIDLMLEHLSRLGEEYHCTESAVSPTDFHYFSTDE